MFNNNDDVIPLPEKKVESQIKHERRLFEKMAQINKREHGKWLVQLEEEQKKENNKIKKEMD